MLALEDLANEQNRVRRVRSKDNIHTKGDL